MSEEPLRGGAARAAAPPIEDAALIACVSEWWAGREPRVIPPGAVCPAPEVGRGPGVRWLDLDVTAIDAGEPAQRDRAIAWLRAWLAWLHDDPPDEHMLVDLLGCTGRPQSRGYPGSDVRLASSFQAEFTKPRVLSFQPVACLAGPGWLITCWHRGQEFAGAKKTVCDLPPNQHDHIFGRVAPRWQKGPARSAGDLGVLIFDELALTYAPAHRAIYAWLEGWELALYRNSDGNEKGPPIDRLTLPLLWEAMAVLRDWINPLNVPGLRADMNKAWFSGCTDREAVIDVDKRVDRALADLRQLSETLRSSFSLLHVQLAEEQRERTERLQRMLEYITAAVLIPALVVGFYGANTRLPGAETWWGFWVMVLAMVALGGGSLLALQWVRGREAARRRRWLAR